MKKEMMIGIMVLVIVIFWFYFKNIRIMEEDEIIEEIKPTPEVLEFMDYYRERIDFDHPYVTCIFNKTCNGTFHLGMDASFEENISQIKEILNKYGEVERVSTFEYYSISFRTDNIYKIGPILNSSFFTNIVLYNVKSDYKLEIPDEELHSCEVDEDCVAVLGCCGCGSGGGSILINKKYIGEWGSYYRLICMGTGCTAVMSSHWTCLGSTAKKCVNNSCKFVNYTGAPCDTRFYSFCRNNLPKSVWDERSSFGQLADGSVTCREIIGLCEMNMSQSEIYEKCINETNIPKEYVKGYVKVSFDPNATEEEIDNFINDLRLEVERRLSDYYYVIETPSGELTEKFIIYLKSLPNIKSAVKSKNSNLVAAEFYGNISIEKSKELIRDYEDLEIDVNSLEIFDYLPRLGIIKVPEGTEVEWICKFKEEKLVYDVDFKS